MDGRVKGGGVMETLQSREHTPSHRDPSLSEPGIRGLDFPPHTHEAFSDLEASQMLFLLPGYQSLPFLSLTLKTVLQG